MDNKINLLIEAIKKDNQTVINTLIRQGVEVNLPNKNGWYALDYAVDNWCSLIIQKLIEAGADVNYLAQRINDDFGSLLYEAAKRGAVALVDLLIEKGADINYSYHGVSTPVDIAVESKQHEIIIKLAAAGADLDVNLFEGKNTLMAAMEEKRTEEAIILINVGANPNAVSDYGWTPLMSAAYYGYLEIAQLLLDKGASLDYAVPREINGKIMTDYGHRPILAAISGQQWVMLQFLIGKGADIAIEDRSMTMPLLLTTIYYKEFEATKILIAAGADIFGIADQGVTTVYLICTAIKEMQETLQLAKGENVSAYQKKKAQKIIAQKKINQAYEFLQYFLDKGCSAHTLVSQYRRNQISALELALESKHLPTIELLLKYGAKSKFYDLGKQSVNLIEQLNIQDQERLALLENAYALAIENLNLAPAIQEILQHWDSLYQQNFFPYSNGGYEDRFMLLNIRLDVYTNGATYKLIFQQFGYSFGSCNYENWVATISEKTTKIPDWQWHPIKISDCRRNRDFWDYENLDTYYIEQTRLAGYKTPDLSEHWGRLQGFNIELNQQRFFLTPSWEDYRQAGMRISKEAYNLNRTIKDDDLIDIARHLLAQKIWFNHPLKEIKLEETIDNWLLVYQDNGGQILEHNAQGNTPSSCFYWQNVAQRIVEQKSLVDYPLPIIDDLERVLNIELNIPSLKETPEKYGLIYELSLDYQIQNFDALANCYNLRKLLLFGTNIKDLSPLSNLKQLRELNLFSTFISDIKPLSTLQNLTRLNLSHTDVEDLSPLSHLTQMEYLDLEDTKIDSIDALKNLVNLKELRIGETAITDIAVLENMPNISRLGIWNTHITDLSSLRKVKKLQVLWAEKTPIKDIQVLAEMENLRYVRLDGALVEDWTPLLQAEKLKELRISNKVAKEKARKQLADSSIKIV